MRKAGGIIAIIAGVFGVLAAFITLMVGELGSAFEANGADQVVWLGWGGVVFSFATVALGAVCVQARSALPGVLLITASIAGVVLGGTLVALFMILSLVGGLLATFGGMSDNRDEVSAEGRTIRPLLQLKTAQEPTSSLSDPDQVIARYLQQQGNRRSDAGAGDEPRRGVQPTFGRRAAG